MKIVQTILVLLVFGGVFFLFQSPRRVSQPQLIDFPEARDSRNERQAQPEMDWFLGQRMFAGQVLSVLALSALQLRKEAMEHSLPRRYRHTQIESLKIDTLAGKPR